MKQLRDVMRGIPGGWWYLDPDTNMKVVAGCYQDLLANVALHRRGNGLKVPLDLDLTIQDQLCSRIPDSFITEAIKEKVALTEMQELSVTQKVEALHRVWKDTGRLIVDPGVMQVRSRVCRFCQCNKPTTCLECNGVYDWLCQKFHLPQFEDDRYLHSCSVDRVYNKAQVHLDVEVFARKAPRSSLPKYPAECWKRQLLETYFKEHSDGQ